MDVFVIEQVIDLGGVNMPMIYRQALTQHDAYAHEWRVSIKRHGHAVDLTGCTAQIYFGPENRTGDGIEPGKAMTQSATAQGGAAYAELLPELYQIDGRVMAIMQISDPEDHVMTAAVLRLHTSGVLEGDIGDPSGSVIELGALLAQLDELRTQTAAAREATAQSMAQQEAAEAAETARSAAESERVAAENYRVGHESTRQMHENDRVAHEKTRISSETTRRNAETERAAAETARSDAETARSEAEQQRAAAEEARDAAETDRESAEQARAAAEQARQETFAGYEERIVAATPDDTTVDGRAWTSKKTVDSLCMPIEATGNPVQVYPVEGYPLGVKVSWEPAQEGEGDPSPENIRPISGRNKVSVTRCGKNLSQRNSFGGVSWAYNDAKTTKLINSLPAGTYKISFTITLTSFSDRFTSDTAVANGLYAIYTVYDGSASYGKQHFIGTVQNIYRTDTLPKSVNVSATIVIEEAVAKFEKDLYFYGCGRNNAAEGAPNGALGTAEVSNLQIEFGSAPTPYEPYTGSTTDIALPETVYGGTLDVETGVVTVTHCLVTLTGEENWDKTGNYLSTVTNPIGIRGEYGVCTHYPYWDGVGDFNFGNGYYVSHVGWAFIVAGGIGSIFMVDEWKAHLAEQKANGTPVQVSYALKTPYTIQLTPQQIAALSGVNTLYTDGDSLTVTGREDPRHTIVTLTDRIAALESAAAGV